MNTFGDVMPLARKEAKAGVPFIRLHMMWKDAHNFSEADFPFIRDEAARACPTVIANPQTKWYFSGACEHHLNEKQARQLAEIVTSACPQAEYVNTPAPQGAILPEYINEFHGTDPVRCRPGMRCAFSFDGSAAEDSNVEKFKRLYSNAIYLMFWGPRDNGRWESNDSTPRPLRKGWPDAKWLRSMAYLATDRGPVDLPKNYIWKSHSENKGNGDPRAEKPVAIFPIKVKKLELRRDGQVLATMPYYGTFADGRHRYYAPSYGYEIGRVTVWADGKRIGNVNAGFRTGGFRE